MNKILALVSGLLMGLGMLMGGMVNPQKVIDFLNFSLIPQGLWNPSLIFVMGGGLLVTIFGFAFIKKSGIRPLLVNEYCVSAKRKVDAKLIGGASLFGFGWGIVGVCPGPALVGLLSFDIKVFFTAVMMVVGVMVGRQLSLRF
ncbi:MAG: DUF6691 family protein [Alphaproteobacteria bacterium]